MLKKGLSMVLLGVLFVVGSLAQTTNNKLETVAEKTNNVNSSFTTNGAAEAGSINLEKIEKENSTLPAKRRLSKGAKIGIWAAVIVGGVLLAGFIVYQSIKPKDCTTVSDNLVCR